MSKVSNRCLKWLIIKTRPRTAGWNKIIQIRYLTCKRNITKLINLIWHINIRINIKIILILLNWFYIHKIYFKGVFPNSKFQKTLKFHDFSWYSTRYKNFENSMWSDLEVWKRHTINFIKMDEKYWKFGFFNQKVWFFLWFSRGLTRFKSVKKCNFTLRTHKWSLKWCLRLSKLKICSIRYMNVNCRLDQLI